MLMLLKFKMAVTYILPRLSRLQLHKTFYQSYVKKSDYVVVSKQKHLHIIGLNRPEKRNCVNSEMAKQLTEAFETFENDEEAYVAVLYGKGGSFCSGYDLQEISQGKVDDINEIKGPMGPTHRFLKKPVIAAVSGYAVAGGFELALWCDMRVVEDTAVMGVFCRRFGVPLIDGGTVRLPQLIGLSRAMELILTGRGINSKEALEMGIATRVVPCGTSLGNAVNLANSLCKFPQECLRADRYSAYHSMCESKSIKEALEFETKNSIHVLSAESVEGAKTFMRGIGRHGKFHLDAEPTKELE